jgi:hypothetical protein
MHIVYQIIWPATRNVYYGLTKDLCRRLAKHCRFAVNGDNAPLYAAMRLILATRWMCCIGMQFAGTPRSVSADTSAERLPEAAA